MSMPNQSGPARKPIHEIKLSRIRVSIWENGGEGQRTWYSVAVSRSYRDGEVWKETTSFNRDDLPIVAKAAEMAYAWIWSRTIQTREAQEIREQYDAR